MRNSRLGLAFSFATYKKADPRIETFLAPKRWSSAFIISSPANSRNLFCPFPPPAFVSISIQFNLFFGIRFLPIELSGFHSTRTFSSTILISSGRNNGAIQCCFLMAKTLGWTRNGWKFPVEKSNSGSNQCCWLAIDEIFFRNSLLNQNVLVERDLESGFDLFHSTMQVSLMGRTIKRETLGAPEILFLVASLELVLSYIRIKFQTS